jgi:GH25 family lysozyme M1 (1,4-beta-N-acetylmuramidase)
LLRFIDWSLNNPALPDWSAEKERGLSGAILKTSEGTYGRYAQTKTNWDTLAAQSLLRGLYDFGMPDLDAPIAEANYFLSTCQAEGISFAPYDTIWLDFERIGQLGASSPADWAVTWLSTVENQVGYAPGFPGIYCTLDYVEHVLVDPRLSKYTLWLAAWTTGSSVPNSDPPPQSAAPVLPSGSSFRDYGLWQWSASSYYFQSVVIPGAGVDESLSFLSRDQFCAKYGKRPPAPKQQWKVVVDQWLRAEPDAASARLINCPVGAIVSNYGAPTPHWLQISYQGYHGWVLRSNTVPI